MTNHTSSELLSNAVAMSGAYSRPNWYSVEISPPPGLRYKDASLRRLSMNCSEAALPGRGFATIVYDQGGIVPVSYPHTPIYSEIQTQFYVSDDMMEQEFFQDWHDIINPNRTSGEFEYPEKYKSTVTIRKLSRVTRDSRKTRTSANISLIRCWPSQVGDVRLAYGDRDAICVIPVTLNYHFWERIE